LTDHSETQYSCPNSLPTCLAGSIQIRLPNSFLSGRIHATA
jgi:hypothetical protein